MSILERNLYSRLVDWKKQDSRKPLILFGARQVGKTFLLCQQFGPREFENFHVFNFKKYGDTLIDIFRSDFDIKRIVTALSILGNRSIHLNSDLVIFDEVQQCPIAIESLKYFAEEAPNSYIIATGSMLRAKLMSPNVAEDIPNYSFSFPVGKVTELNLYPLTFDEFVIANANELLLVAYKELDRSLIVHNKLLDLYRDYLFVGGMPEAVKIWNPAGGNIVENISEVRKVQNDLISAYKRDFISKENMSNGTHLSLVYDSLFTQIQHSLVHDRTSKRFKFREIIPKKNRFDDLRNIIDWLENSGLIHKIYVIDCAPLNSPDSFIRHNLFKLVPHDVGLLNAKLQHSYKEIKIDELGLVKGAIAEVFVANEIKASILKDQSASLISWIDKKAAYEIEFLLKSDSWGVYPMEVKGGKNKKSTSLKKYQELFEPKISIKLSSNPGGTRESDFLTLPIYYAARHREIVEKTLLR